jgi:hypothetical protein
VVGSLDGVEDGFVAWIDADGSVARVDVQVGAAGGEDAAHAVAVDDEGKVVVAGSYDEQGAPAMFVRAFDAWDLVEDGARAHALAFLPDGDVVLVGSNDEGFVRRLDRESGSLVWERAVAIAADQSPSLDVTPDGEIVIGTASSISAWDESGEPTWSAAFDAAFEIRDWAASDRGFVMAGRVGDSSAARPFAALRAPGGAARWTDVADALGPGSQAWAVTASTSEAITVAGLLGDAVTLFVRHIDATGTRTWTSTWTNGGLVTIADAVTGQDDSTAVVATIVEEDSDLLILAIAP